MNYFAHIDKNGKKQTNKAHLEGTARLAGRFADTFGAYEWGFCCGMLHDIGKYSTAFQDRLFGSGKPVDHSTAGAKLCWNMGGLYSLLSYCIAGHHAGLPDTGETSDTSGAATLQGRLKKYIEDYQEYTHEIQMPVLKNPPFELKKGDNPDFLFSVFIRMLYSSLVDADYLDTEAFMQQGESSRDSGEKIEVLLEKLKGYISGWLPNMDTETVNGRRTEILKNCLNQGKCVRGLFSLTVPTGGGKTIASLAFALQHAAVHKMDRVIYVIPYTSIIEQNAKVFSDIAGKENVLEHHCNVDYEAGEELEAMQLAAENWDSPIIVTTNVQFFESLYANKSSRCRKLHNIANSVIIFDEAQMLPTDYLKPCVAIMDELLRHYKTSIVLCTATQPALQEMFSNGRKATELCPRAEEQVRFFKRVTLKNLNSISEEELIKRLSEEEQALCILNTKKRVQAVFKKLEREGVYHLSTSMYPIHRKKILSLIRGRLKDGRRCIVISTSLVEAGVDLDFRTVYRQQAGADSIIQAAGRCNREGTRPVDESVAYIFRFEEKEYVPGQSQQIAVTGELLQNGEDLFEPSSIQRYFKMLYHLRGESLDKKDVLGQFSKKRFPFARVSREFKLIEQNTVTVLIDIEERAGELLREIEMKGPGRRLMREAAQYCINVYENDFQKLYAAGMLGQITEELKDFFVLRDHGQYTEAMGLAMDVKYGRAVLF